VVSHNGVTIIDIARTLGVSAMTVSRALRGSTEISEETRLRVVRCAEKMSYRPNRWARTLVTRRSSIIGLVVPDIAHSYFAEITRGIEEVIEKAGYSLLLCHSRMDPHRERREIDTLVGSRVEGLIVASEQPENSAEPFLHLKAENVPFVLIDRFFPEHDFPTVRVDDLSAGTLATEHLISLGHRRIAHIQGPSLSPATLRAQGYVETLNRYKVPFRKGYVLPGKFDVESGREAMKKLLDLRVRPTAVFAANDPMAIGAMYACREAGVDVPGEMSIIGSGNIEGAYHPYPFLTTIDWPRFDLGRTAGGMLLSAIASTEHGGTRAETFAPQLLSRQSTGRPKPAAG
jgi:LacI family transcriptional regulator